MGERHTGRVLSVPWSIIAGERPEIARLHRALARVLALVRLSHP